MAQVLFSASKAEIKWPLKVDLGVRGSKSFSGTGLNVEYKQGTRTVLVARLDEIYLETKDPAGLITRLDR